MKQTTKNRSTMTKTAGQKLIDDDIRDVVKRAEIEKAKSSLEIPDKVTPVEYNGLQQAYYYLNVALFDGKLGDVFITLQRRAHSTGYFSANRFSSRLDQSGRHEVALNPDAYISSTDKQIAQTLAHEMTHVWQHQFGKPSARGYHNKQWAEKLKAIGLMPSSTGMVGGKETGQRMSDYIIPGGTFEQAFKRLEGTGWRVTLQSAPCAGGIKAPSSKTKSSCRHCGGNAWSKPNYGLNCTECLKRAVYDAFEDLTVADSVVALLEHYRMMPETQLDALEAATT
jgi:hypothetical protein